MTDLRKAAEMALEALEWNYGTDLENIENCMAWLDKMNATIPALRQALAQPENQQPTKIFGPSLEEILNAAGFYRKGKWVDLTDEEMDRLCFSKPNHPLTSHEIRGRMLIAIQTLRERNGA